MMNGVGFVGGQPSLPVLSFPNGSRWRLKLYQRRGTHSETGECFFYFHWPVGFLSFQTALDFL